MNNIRTDKDKIELILVTPIYKNKVVKDKVAGEVITTQVLSKELRVPKWINRDGITSVEAYVDSKNGLAKNRSIIFDKYSSKFYATFHSVDDVRDSLGSNTSKIGFK